MNLQEVYAIGLKHAIRNIVRNGGTVDGENIIIPVQQPIAVQFEKSFEGLFPVDRFPVQWKEKDKVLAFSFEGTGFVLTGEAAPWAGTNPTVLSADVVIDGEKTATHLWPVSYTTRSNELCWNYSLPNGKHTVEVRIANPDPAFPVRVGQAIIYSDKPLTGFK